MSKMLGTLYVMGAYGRFYTSKESLFTDWDAGKDFKVINGPYFSKRDIAKIREENACIAFRIHKPEEQYASWYLVYLE